ncbi:geraniol 8-hydroxylase-like [Senna tora]|uniref:Geraniol 8-hydroxylase-like n=1 Tax=Senna tora TaxID=362788 RepID=A0A834WD58_9FABA|nr:geraniol 8-hydroxylase-like [Senna tora]
MEIHIFLLSITLPLVVIRLFLNRRRHIKPAARSGRPPHHRQPPPARPKAPPVALRLGPHLRPTPIAAPRFCKRWSSPPRRPSPRKSSKRMTSPSPTARFSSRSPPSPTSATPSPGLRRTTGGATAGASAAHRYSPPTGSTCCNTCASVRSSNSLSTFRNHSLEGTQVDIGELAFATMLNLVSNTVFSVDLVDPEFETAGEFKEVVWRIMEDAGKPNLADYFPALKKLDVQGVRRHVSVSYKRLHQIFDHIIQKRIKDRENSSARNGDFLDVLLDHCQDGSDFSVESIKPLILDLFIAGSDTSGSSTEWAMAELLRNPEIMQKARNELNQVIGPHIGQPKESDIPRLPYIQAIVKETLRLHPPVPLLLPYIAENDVVVSGYTIRKGDQVLINAWSIGRNPSFWDDPTSFLPERFVGSTLDFKGRDFEYLPFGAGRRICPGLPLANRMISLMLATLVHSFEWELPEGVTRENMDMSEHQLGCGHIECGGAILISKLECNSMAFSQKHTQPIPWFIQGKGPNLLEFDRKRPKCPLSILIPVCRLLHLDPSSCTSIDCSHMLRLRRPSSFLVSTISSSASVDHRASASLSSAQLESSWIPSEANPKQIWVKKKRVSVFLLLLLL